MSNETGWHENVVVHCVDVQVIEWLALNEPRIERRQAKRRRQEEAATAISADQTAKIRSPATFDFYNTIEATAD